MKFIYCMNPDVAKDLESAGLQKIGKAMIDGKEIPVFANNKSTYLNIYQKGEILLTNKLFFTPIKE